MTRSDPREPVALRPAADRLAVAPGTLALLADVLFTAPLAAKVLDAYLTDRGADPARAWRLVLTGAEIVADDPAPAGAGAGRDGG